MKWWGWGIKQYLFVKTSPHSGSLGPFAPQRPVEVVASEEEDGRRWGGAFEGCSLCWLEWMVWSSSDHSCMLLYPPPSPPLRWVRIGFRCHKNIQTWEAKVRKIGWCKRWEEICIRPVRHREWETEGWGGGQLRQDCSHWATGVWEQHSVK